MKRNNVLLRIERLSLSFETFDGTEDVVTDVNIEIDRGEVVGLVGESGCGKTITAKTVIGTLPQPPARIKSGRILLNGTDLLALDAGKRREFSKHISFIPQDPMLSLNPVFSVGEQLVDLIIWHGKPDFGLGGYVLSRGRRKSGDRDQARAEGEKMLASVNIADPDRIFRSYPDQLSGGMRQRVLIAMALMGDPSVIIADEPGTGLDVSIQDQILDLMKTRVKGQDVSVLFITHDLGVARRICDRIYVMYGGQVAEAAETEVLFSKTKHPYTMGLLECVPKVTGERMGKGIPGNIPDYYHPPSGCRFHPRCPQRMDICDKRTPRLGQIEKEKLDHKVACFLYPESM
jgi:oligopeptide/dipeptide ABC transporter ATP-binding protein